MNKITYQVLVDDKVVLTTTNNAKAFKRMKVEIEWAKFAKDSLIHIDSVSMQIKL